MELRTLRYFLALASQGTVSKAAASLNVTQPTLSRQLADLEKEFGKQLFVRGTKRIQLTEDGTLLRDYAQTIVALADKAAAELSLPAHAIAGAVRIGCGEARASRAIWRAIAAMRRDYPQVKFHIYSGNSADLGDRFESGLFDFMEECEVAGHGDCNVVMLPEKDRWGVVMRADDPLASLERIRPEDLEGATIIGSRQGMKVAGVPEWAGPLFETMQVAATYNLVFNGAAMARVGVGYCFCYEDLVDLGPESGLVFRPLEPELISTAGLIWKKHRRLSRAAEVFLGYLRAEVEERDSKAGLTARRAFGSLSSVE